MGVLSDRDQAATPSLNADMYGAYDAFTPTLVGSSSDPSLGSGATVYGYYKHIGRRCFGYGFFSLGSGFSAGSGNYGVVLPVEPASRIQPAGTGYLINAADVYRVVLGALVFTASYFPYTSKKAVFLVSNGAGEGAGNGYNPVAAAVPWAWSDGSQIAIQFDYETAADSEA